MPIPVLQIRMLQSEKPVAASCSDAVHTIDDVRTMADSRVTRSLTAEERGTDLGEPSRPGLSCGLFNAGHAY